MINAAGLKKGAKSRIPELVRKLSEPKQYSCRAEAEKYEPRSKRNP